MVNAEDEILIDFSTSCTKDLAVAKMLGWMKGHRRNRIVLVTEHGISADEFPHLFSLEDSLAEKLLELREAARQELITAAENDASHEVLGEKEKAVAECDALIDKAGSYLLAIDEELFKGDSSELKIDQDATKSSGHIHLTINSVDRWAHTRYGIAIKGTTDSESLSEDNPELQHSPQEELDNDCKGGLSKTKAENLYTTLAFLIEAFAKMAPKYHQDSNPKASLWRFQTKPQQHPSSPTF